jgi:hypothetical protein
MLFISDPKIIQIAENWLCECADESLSLPDASSWLFHVKAK